MTGTGEAVLFWIAAPLMVLGALGLAFSRRAVYAALSMVMTMILFGVVYLAQGADFLGIVQIFVYSGAVMMLFIFVIMMVGVDASETRLETMKGHRFVSVLVGLGLILLLGSTLGGVAFRPGRSIAEINEGGNVVLLGHLIFGPYMAAFQMIGVLLVVAAIAAMVLAHRERLLPKPDQRAWSKRRIAENKNVAGLPAPGVYARHNAVDTPALLPDGTPSELSVSRILVARDQLNRPTTFSEATVEMEHELEEGADR
ncbi:NADH-quinone oxidoreductase subunit J [Mobilicoccus pelagius]|uniref:NADH-quinone oxidoreductase subunit J n=1 Tax=Mobilicoccus pelagius NBRC 104925 TaxID=1089455 RepID=H5UQC3_9MICO|nr:NADH-quinone oxidoreductase subunit J [Mobilicoccus pelagius]GAB47931.1 NADH-quinone oxidoreductase subunit J [Mobilicoccus pelagius NBRC 104925]